MILWEFDLKNNIQSSDILLIKIFKGGGYLIWNCKNCKKKKSYQDFFFSMIWNMWSETFVIYNALITFIGSLLETHWNEETWLVQTLMKLLMLLILLWQYLCVRLLK